MTYNKMLIKDVKKDIEFYVWQQVDESQLIAYVNEKGEPVKLPKLHEGTMLDTDLEAIE